MHKFRLIDPKRTCVKTYKRYRSFKRFLIVDFNESCGYCNSSHTWHGGYKHYHIDHFAPKSLFPDLETEYDNLVYSCPLCNLAKSDKWISDNPNKNIVNGEGFLDPCKEDFNEHFNRDKKGFITGVSAEAKYMVKEMNLNLEIHSVTWELSRLERLIDDYSEKLNNNQIKDDKREDAKKVHYKLLVLFYDYLNRIKELKN